MTRKRSFLSTWRFNGISGVLQVFVVNVDFVNDKTEFSKYAECMAQNARERAPEEAANIAKKPHAQKPDSNNKSVPSTSEKAKKDACAREERWADREFLR